MSEALSVSTLGAHVRYPSQEGVIDALVRLGVGRGAPVPVWPPRRLPYGLFVSPVRDGWVSLWSPLGDVREWLPRLTATLECPGVLMEVIQSQFWIAEFLRDDDFVGRLELPTEAVAWDDLWARTTESLEAEGVEQPWEDEARFGARMDEIAASPEYQEDVRALREERPHPEALRPFLPPHASLEQAWELLTAIDRREAAGEDEEISPYAEDYLEGFAGYLGIRDAAWNPFADAEALSEGDYEDEEGLPEGWRDFVVLPVPQLPVL
jgi:hypothetical protein